MRRPPARFLPFRRWAALLVMGAAMIVVPIGTMAAPAHAEGCGNRGHAYVVDPFTNALYLSGCSGDLRYGVPTLEVFPGDVVQLAGNNILPGARIDYEDDGAGLIPGGSYATTRAGSGGVVRQEQNAFSINTVPAGTYRLFASYTTEESVRVDDEPVVDIRVSRLR
ncbi:hypothetical protein [Spirillospora sp. NPDC047279]|uniref:hypothetical protein n=1 Tax=Spirillospora sp. NPDC047279 TaxID=3155478 RepID=UPI0033FF3CA3